MKFGNNLCHLSIPEWGSYNIDYNDLKSQIRVITQTNKSDIRPLYQSFIKNFDFINLFIETKYGELNRRIDSLQTALDSIETEPMSHIHKLIHLDEILYRTLDISTTVKKLSKYILVQKIACKKIFKKFIKHYQDSEVAERFIGSLMNRLKRNKKSFINFDLTELTLRLTYLMDTTKFNHKRTQVLTNQSRNLRSASSVRSTSFDNINNNEPNIFPTQQFMNNSDSRFDLTVHLRKNFALYFLIGNDSNDILLYLNVYLNLENCTNNTSLMSITYLQDEKFQHEPSYILSYENESSSVLVSHVGGLRTYSYCILPNDIVKLFITRLTENNASKLKSANSSIRDYFHQNKPTVLTRTAIDTITQKKKVPKMKVICNRSRYILKKELTDEDNQSHLTLESTDSNIKKHYQDDYYISLDTDIYTTSNADKVKSLEFSSDGFEKYPFSSLSLYSNDSNLSNFRESLQTDIENHCLKNTYSSRLLKKLPESIQKLINNNTSLNLFKDLSYYQYMSSCYFNKIPDDQYINNHYSHLLNLNLLKNFENIDDINNQEDAESVLIRQKSDRILKHQMSLKNISQQNLAETRSFVSLASSFNNSIFTSHEVYSKQEQDQDPDITLDQYTFDNYLKNQKPDGTTLDNFILRFIKFRSNFNTQAEEKALIGGEDYQYDSLNEDISFFNRNGLEYQEIYERQYDNSLTYAYFSLTLVSLLIAGIELGIIYSIMRVSGGSSKISLLDNIWLVFILAIGLLSSLIFSIVGVILNSQRSRLAPLNHTIILWSGLSVVCVCSTWSIIILSESMGLS